jgi:hypothetical protein
MNDAKKTETMNDVMRFHLVVNEDRGDGFIRTGLEQKHDGPWVKFDDAETAIAAANSALAKSNAELAAEIVRLTEERDICGNEVLDLRSELRQRDAEIARLKAEVECSDRALATGLAVALSAHCEATAEPAPQAPPVGDPSAETLTCGRCDGRGVVKTDYLGGGPIGTQIQCPQCKPTCAETDQERCEHAEQERDRLRAGLEAIAALNSYAFGNAWRIARRTLGLPDTD